MGLFDTFANSAYAAKLEHAVARQLGIRVSDLSDIHKRGLGQMASQYRQAGVSPDQAAQWYVQGLKDGR